MLRRIKRLITLRRSLIFSMGLLVAWGIIWYIIPVCLSLPIGLVQPPTFGTTVLDKDGHILVSLPGDDYYHSYAAQLHEIPEPMIQATLAAEDKRFFSHSGVDFISLGRAVLSNLWSGRVVSGASTITQQLAKISSPPRPRTIGAKICEFFYARRIEMSFNKEEILEAYFQRLDYGNLRRGPHTAARFYFGKELNDLSLAEYAMLAGLPQGPSRLNPLKHPKQALERRQFVLERLREQGNYSDESILRAHHEPLITKLPKDKQLPLIPDLASDILEQNRKGIIKTTLSKPLQQGAIQIIHDELARLHAHNVTQAAVIVTDNSSGHILTLIGSADRNNPLGGQHDGTKLLRSPGSTLKPFVYAQAFEHGAYPGTILPDIPTIYRSPNGTDAPENYNKSYMGPISIRQALACSQNIPAMRALEIYGGTQKFQTLLHQLGFSEITKPADFYGFGIAIGNAEVSLRHLAAAYTCLARQGSYIPIVWEKSEQSPQQILKKSTCFLVSDILSDREARRASFHDSEVMNLPFKYACKTGTSSDYRDNWCMGFTKEFTVGVWVGNFDNSPMFKVGGMTGAAPIFARILSLAHSQRQANFPTPPDEVKQIHIDSRTGKQIGSCDIPKIYHATEWSPRDHLPNEASVDDYDEKKRVKLDSIYKDWVTRYIGENHAKWVLDEQLWTNTFSPKITSPVNRAHYVLDPELPHQGNTLKLESNLPPGGEWSCPSLHIYKKDNSFYLQLTPGTHTITLNHPILHITLKATISVSEI